MAVEFPCGQDGVLELLPHRDPFVWVSRIQACEPGVYIQAELDISPDLPIFKGHFPGHPIFPGVLIMEALAQAACCCIMAAPDRQTSLGYLTGIDKAKFRETALPGDTICLEAHILKANRRFCKAQVIARKGDKIVAEGIQSYVLAKPDLYQNNTHETEGVTQTSATEENKKMPNIDPINPER